MAPPKKDATCREKARRGLKKQVGSEGGLLNGRQPLSQPAGPLYSIGPWCKGWFWLTMWNMVKKSGKVNPTRSENTSLLKKLRPMFRKSHVTSTMVAMIVECCQPEEKRVLRNRTRACASQGEGRCSPRDTCRVVCRRTAIVGSLASFCPERGDRTGARKNIATGPGKARFGGGGKSVEGRVCSPRQRLLQGKS